jgi:hypothetical protein
MAEFDQTQFIELVAHLLPLRLADIPCLGLPGPLLAVPLAYDVLAELTPPVGQVDVLKPLGANDRQQRLVKGSLRD